MKLVWSRCAGEGSNLTEPLIPQFLEGCSEKRRTVRFIGVMISYSLIFHVSGGFFEIIRFPFSLRGRTVLSSARKRNFSKRCIISYLWVLVTGVYNFFMCSERSCQLISSSSSTFSSKYASYSTFFLLHRYCNIIKGHRFWRNRRGKAFFGKCTEC